MIKSIKCVTLLGILLAVQGDATSTGRPMAKLNAMIELQALHVDPPDITRDEVKTYLASTLRNAIAKDLLGGSTQNISTNRDGQSIIQGLEQSKLYTIKTNTYLDLYWDWNKVKTGLYGLLKEKFPELNENQLNKKLKKLDKDDCREMMKECIGDEKVRLKQEGIENAKKQFINVRGSKIYYRKIVGEYYERLKWIGFGCTTSAHLGYIISLGTGNADLVNAFECISTSVTWITFFVYLVLYMLRPERNFADKSSGIIGLLAIMKMKTITIAVMNFVVGKDVVFLTSAIITSISMLALAVVWKFFTKTKMYDDLKNAIC